MAAPRPAVGSLHFVLNRVRMRGLGHLGPASRHLGALRAKRAPKAMDSGDLSEPKITQRFCHGHIGERIARYGTWEDQMAASGSLQVKSELQHLFRGIAQRHDVLAPHLCPLCRNDPLKTHIGEATEPLVPPLASRGHAQDPELGTPIANSQL
jgi:hypothetical protein